MVVSALASKWTEFSPFFSHLILCRRVPPQPPLTEGSVLFFPFLHSVMELMLCVCLWVCRSHCVLKLHSCQVQDLYSAQEYRKRQDKALHSDKIRLNTQTTAHILHVFDRINVATYLNVFIARIYLTQKKSSEHFNTHKAFHMGTNVVS